MLEECASGAVDDGFGFSGGAGGIENVEWMGEWKSGEGGGLYWIFVGDDVLVSVGVVMIFACGN